MSHRLPSELRLLILYHLPFEKWYKLVKQFNYYDLVSILRRSGIGDDQITCWFPPKYGGWFIRDKFMIEAMYLNNADGFELQLRALCPSKLNFKFYLTDLRNSTNLEIICRVIKQITFPPLVNVKLNKTSEDVIKKYLQAADSKVQRINLVYCGYLNIKTWNQTHMTNSQYQFGKLLALSQKRKLIRR